MLAFRKALPKYYIGVPQYGDQWFSTYAKFTEKLTFAHQGLEILVFGKILRTSRMDVPPKISRTSLQLSIVIYCNLQMTCNLFIKAIIKILTIDEEFWKSLFFKLSVPMDIFFIKLDSSPSRQLHLQS